ncbi:hypothetical protein CBR_g4406 [Chara braunii]|uniref:Bifunctional inhibitor/plant lipid transfer protein/seed storage helical domain-containing protein n=1 Tax=Chara braunii TaxID=69332 RepID=A0A388KHX7_CHABU|nr:hypothetical protein CBR_g4406 [Chara braunii]|eukprot:GBG69573.1 hypothetical protein CBR_g4406 [Chara braunii]
MKVVRAFAVLLALSIVSSAAVADMVIESPVGNVETTEASDPCNGANLDWASLKDVCDLNSPKANRRLCCFNVDLLLSQIFESESFNAKCALSFSKVFEKNGYAHIAWNYEQICGRPDRRGLAAESSLPSEAPEGGPSGTTVTTVPSANGKNSAPSSAPASNAALSISAPTVMQLALAFLAVLFLR